MINVASILRPEVDTQLLSSRLTGLVLTKLMALEDQLHFQG
jgi:hypothetical protein